jgi:ATP/ADP translocase
LHLFMLMPCLYGIVGVVVVVRQSVWPRRQPLDVSAPAGMVGMVRNWLFTVFYCVSELWGDVVLSLLFWGLANETTSIEDAPLLYPLFGIGANIAQTMAGGSHTARKAVCASQAGKCGWHAGTSGQGGHAGLCCRAGMVRIAFAW